MESLEQHGVLVFRELHIDDETQVAFSKKLDDVGKAEPAAAPSIYIVSLDPAKSPTAAYTRGHVPLAHRRRPGRRPHQGHHAERARVSAVGGETEFASTYAAYDDLSDAEKEAFETLRVVHSFEASQRLVHPDPTAEEVARWRAKPDKEHPLVWRHRSGRRSLVIGVSAARVVGLSDADGASLLADLLQRATVAGASTGTSGRWGTSCCGTTPASCTAPFPTTPPRPARCTGRP